MFGETMHKQFINQNSDGTRSLSAKIAVFSRERTASGKIMENELQNVENTKIENVENTKIENVENRDYILEGRKIEQCLISTDVNRISLVLSGEAFDGFNKTGESVKTNIVSFDTLNLAKMVGDKCEILNLASTLACGKHLSPSFVALCITNAIVTCKRQYHNAGEERKIEGVYSKNCWVTIIDDFKPNISQLFAKAAMNMLENGKYLVEQKITALFE